MAAALATSSTCITLDFGTTTTDLLLAVGLLAIPVVAIPVVARIARRHPSQALRDEGRRQSGVWVFRIGVAITVLGLLGLVTALIVGSFDPSQCERAGGVVIVVGGLMALVGALLVGGGWAFASRAGWVVLATIAVLDGWIFYILVLVDSTERVQGVLLLAFAIHAACIGGVPLVLHRQGPRPDRTGEGRRGRAGARRGVGVPGRLFRAARRFATRMGFRMSSPRRR